MSQSGQAEKGPAEYGREALSQWVDAARYGMRALAARREAAGARPPLRERLDPTKTDKGGKAGDMADLALSKLGAPGRLASKVKLGSRLVGRVTPGSEKEKPADDGDGGAEVEAPDANGVAEGVGAGAPLPIQAAIDVALPVAAVFELCTRFEEYPQIVDRVIAVEVEDDIHFTVAARAGRRRHELSIELLDELPGERLDWECVGDLEHSGVLTFHPLAPRLTRIELTIERDSEGPVEHLGRILALPERGLRQELRRFKAVAELWEEGKAYEPTEIGLFAEGEAPVEEGEEAPEEDEEALEQEGGVEDQEEEAASAER
ncbi:MAG: SRPBCC family protein [Solirubrobacterales bacterium]